MKFFSSRRVISDGSIIENVVLSIDNGSIVDLKIDNGLSNFDFETLCSGFVDLHINGGENFHFTANPTVEALHDIDSAASKNGTAYTLPTIITSPFETIEKAIESVEIYKREKQHSGVLGIHLEGPFLAEKKRGAHLSEYIQKPTIESINEIIDKGSELIKLITIAPELFNQECLKLLIDSPMQVSMGHSNATFKEASIAHQQGINLVTHLYNAMSGIGHRDIGLAGASLYYPDIYCPIILDNHHLSKEAAQLAWKLKGDKLFLISDALFQNRMKQSFEWEGFDAHYQNETYFNSEGNLAGSAISMWDAVCQAMEWFEIPLETALKLATSIPASLIKTERKIGKIEVGYEARLVEIKGESLNVLF